MYQIKTIRADFEGWWLFEGWQQLVIGTIDCATNEEFMEMYQDELINMRNKYHHEVIGKYNIHAFYNHCDVFFCEDCDEDLQIYYSLIPLKNGEIYYENVNNVNA